MKDLLIIICLLILFVLILYRVVVSTVEGIEHQRFRKKNRDAQYSGRVVKEEKGLFSSIISSRHGSRAESLGEFGEGRVSSFLEDLPCEDYQVFNDLLICDRDYTTQIDHIIISRYGVFVIETKNMHGKIYGSEKA